MFRTTDFTYDENNVQSYFNAVHIYIMQVIGSPVNRRISVSGEVIEIG